MVIYPVSWIEKREDRRRGARACTRAHVHVCRCRWQIASLAGSARRTCEKLPRGTRPSFHPVPQVQGSSTTSRSLRTRRESYANLETGSPGIFLRAVGYACALEPFALGSLWTSLCRRRRPQRGTIDGEREREKEKIVKYMVHLYCGKTVEIMIIYKFTSQYYK